MKIAIFTDNFYPETNGLVTALLNQFKIMGKRGHEFLVFSPKYNKELDLWNVKQFCFSSIAIPSYKESRIGFPDKKKIKRVISMEKPDVIHVHTPFLIGRAGIKAGNKAGIPVIGTYHTKLDNFVDYVSLLELLGIGKYLSLRHSLKKKVSWLLTNAFYRHCDAVTTPTRTMRNALLKNGMRNHIHIISNGVDLGRFKARKNYKSNLRLLHVGRVSYEKRIDVILNAMKHVRKDITLSIAGSGPALRTLKKKRDNLGLRGRVRFIGSVKHDKLNELHHSHDIFVTASDMETQGLAALEGVASGMPMICVNKMAVKELVDGNGFVVQHNDHQSIAWFVNSIIEDEKTLARMGRRSREIAEQHSLDIVADRLERLYEGLITR